MLAPSDSSRHRIDVTRLAAIILLDTGRYHGWQGWMLALWHASKNRTLPGWQRWMLAPSDASIDRLAAPSDASRNRTLPGWQRWLRPIGCFYKGTGWQRGLLAPSEASRNRTLPAWQRWMLGCMLLETGRYKRVGRHGCSPHRMLLLRTGRYQLAGMEARPIGCFYEPDVTAGWQRWMLAPSDASTIRTLPGWPQWMLAPSDASRIRT